MIPQEHKDVMSEMIRKYAKEHNLVPPGDTLEAEIRLRSEIPYLYDDPYKSFREFCEKTGESKWVMTRVLHIFKSLGFKTVKDVASYGTKGKEDWYRIHGINYFCKNFKTIREWLSSIDLGTHMSFNTLEPISDTYVSVEERLIREAGARDSCLCGADRL
jgi:hypothetical protein